MKRLNLIFLLSLIFFYWSSGDLMQTPLAGWLWLLGLIALSLVAVGASLVLGWLPAWGWLSAQALVRSVSSAWRIRSTPAACIGLVLGMPLPTHRQVRRAWASVEVWAAFPSRHPALAAGLILAMDSF